MRISGREQSEGEGRAEAERDGKDYGHVSTFLQAETTVYVVDIKCLAQKWPKLS